MHVGIAFLLVLLLLVVGRLFWVQGLDPGGRAEDAAAQRTLVESIPAVRGEITDSRGTVLARTLQRYDITVDQSAVAAASPARCSAIRPRSRNGWCGSSPT